MNDFLFVSFVVVSSFFLTELIRRYTLKNNFIDRPNERSSHTIPTPRGGGLSIVLIFLITISVTDLLPNKIYIALVGAGVLISTIGLWDDYKHVAAKWRLLVHFFAASWGLYWLGGIEKFQIFNYLIELNSLGIVLVAVLLVWSLNLFNFMDGIDGIAASEAIYVTCAGAFFLWLFGLENFSMMSLVLAASTMGFLILNWPPAKIFMGDVGSGFLGLMIGMIVYISILHGMQIWIWMILLAVFLVDSGMTLFRRIFNGDKWYAAHCSHAYQHAARKWGHKKVTVNVIIINIFWLFPLAFITYLNPDFGLWVTFISFAPLIFIALKFNAGINVR